MEEWAAEYPEEVREYARLVADYLIANGQEDLLQEDAAQAVTTRRRSCGISKNSPVLQARSVREDVRELEEPVVEEDVVVETPEPVPVEEPPPVVEEKPQREEQHETES